MTVASCLMFGGVSGSALADTAAIGSLVVPSMVARGYERPFIAALLAVAGTLALLMPLSIAASDTDQLASARISPTPRKSAM